MVTAGTEKSPFEIRLFGAVEAYRNGLMLDLGGVRARSVLAVLLLHPGQTVPKQRLVEYAWRGDPPATADDLVVAYLSRLRAALAVPGGAIRLVSARPGFRAEIDPDLVDAHRFAALVRHAQRDRDVREDESAVTHLEAALRLWRGNTTALADLDSPWLRGQAQLLAERRLEAVESLAGLHLEAGRPARATALVRDAAVAHPERESLTVTLVKSLIAVGEAARAAQIAGEAANTLVERGQLPGPALRQVQTEALSRRPQRPPVRSGPRHQLPADTRVFTGREAELARLLDLAAAVSDGQPAGRVLVCAIDGMAGIGKSALAIHLAHRLADGFPDGQLFIDLHGYTQGFAPRTAAEALDVLLRALGVPPQQIPADLDERAALYRERLDGTRTLILLDNATGEAQVRPLLPGTAGCVVVVTSRKRLKALDDAHSLSLDLLPAADAIALFRKVAGVGRVPAAGPDLDEVVALCGRLPLALRIAAALLRHRTTWSLGYLAGLLRDRQPRVAAFTDGQRDLTALFDLSYAGLAPPLQCLVRRLGLLPGPDVDIYAAAAMTGADPYAAMSRLEDLVDHNLLGQPVPGRYQFHDLVRIYAQSRAADDGAGDRDAALDRLFDYYLSTAQSANRHLARRTVPYSLDVAHRPEHQPDLPDRRRAAAWMSAELANLATAVESAAGDGRPAHAVALAAAMHGYLYTDGPWTTALDLHATAAAAARALGDRFGEATALHSVGRLRRQLGDYPDAIKAHQRALELYRAIGHRAGQANALDGLGRALFQIADYPAAADVHEQALDLFRAVGDRLGQAGALNGLGRVRYRLGRYPGAAEAHREALGLCRAEGERIGQATALNDLGRVWWRIGDHPAAVSLQESALDLYRAANHRLGQANALNDLGRIHCDTGDYAQALRAQEAALELYRDMGHRLGQANALNDLGRVRLRTGDREGAAAAHRQALQAFCDVGDREGRAEALNRLAAVLTRCGALAEARAGHAAALRLAREIASPWDEAEALAGLAEVDLREGHPETGAGLLRQALAIRRGLGLPDAERLEERIAEVEHGGADACR